MASSRQKTTMNKINRERKLREKRIEKQERKLARANGQSEPDSPFGGEVQFGTEDQLGTEAQFDTEGESSGEQLDGDAVVS